MPRPQSTIRRKSRRVVARRIDRTFQAIAQALIVSYALFMLAMWLSYQPGLEITQVKVTGTQAVDRAGIESTAEKFLSQKMLWKINRNNVVLYPKNSIQESIRVFDSHVKTVDMSVRGHELDIVISEYSPAYLWCPPGGVDTKTFVTLGCSFADENGHIFSSAPDYSGNPFLVFTTATSVEQMTNGTTYSTIYTKEEFEKVKLFLTELTTLQLTPHVVRHTGENDFTVSTDKPWTIRWSSASDPAESVANLTLVLQNINKEAGGEAKLETIDLRFGNKVFYK